MTTEFKEISVGSPLYKAEIALRVEVLRAPTGRAHTNVDRDNDRKGRHFVALAGGNVVACVGFYWQSDGAMPLRHLAVAPALQRRGVGRQLLAFAERQLCSDGVRRIDAEARVDALRFYYACGFAAEGGEYEKHSVLHRKASKALAPAGVGA